jgi:hypothetical protein
MYTGGDLLPLYSRVSSLQSFLQDKNAAAEVSERQQLVYRVEPAASHSSREDISSVPMKGSAAAHTCSSATPQLSWNHACAAPLLSQPQSHIQQRQLKIQQQQQQQQQEWQQAQQKPQVVS